MLQSWHIAATPSLATYNFLHRGQFSRAQAYRDKSREASLGLNLLYRCQYRQRIYSSL